MYYTIFSLYCNLDCKNIFPLYNENREVLYRSLIFFTYLLLLGSVSQAQLSCPPNIDFENGNTGYWKFYTGTCCPIVANTLTGALPNRHVLTSGTALDPYGSFPIVAPGGGNYSLKLGNSSTGAQAERARYHVRVPTGLSNYSLIYRYAVVLQNPGHTVTEQPRFEVKAYDSATNALLTCGQFSYVSSSSLPGFTLSPYGSQVWYKSWSSASIDLSGQAGKTIIVEFSSGDCGLSGHFGYGYVDMNCSLFQIQNVNCNGSPWTSLSAPPGFQLYKWYNANFTQIATGQNVVIPTPPTTTHYYVVLTPYAGYGCADTLMTTVSINSFSVNTINDTFVCNNGNIQLNTNIIGGSSTFYSYVWTPSTGLSCSTCASPVATPLVNTKYKVTATDGNGCTRQDSVTIHVGPVTSTVSITPVSCFGDSTGSATVAISQGVSPYTFAWSTQPQQTASTATQLSAGTYQVIVTDAHGCKDTTAITINQPPALNNTFTSNHISCKGGNNGTITVATTGGITPYSYAWSTTPSSSSPTVNNLVAGTYWVTTTDTNGCTQTDTIQLTEPSLPLSAQSSKTHVSCKGGNNGTAIVVASGGTPPYSYTWNTVPSLSAASIANLVAGTYTYTITDSKGCVYVDSVIITEPLNVLSASLSKSNVSCMNGQNGAATVTANGGTAPYTYSWNTTPIQTSGTITNLIAGSYTVTVTDTNGCTTTASTSITQPTALNTSIIKTDVKCFNGNDGVATVTASGGTTPYSYTWNTSPVQLTNTATNLPQGNYQVIVTDSNGCLDTASVTILQPTALTGVSSQTNVSCFGGNNATATIVASGGVLPYSYQWNTSPAQFTPSIASLTAGNYVISVTDGNGCVYADTIVVLQPLQALSATLTKTNVSCMNGMNGSVVATPSGGTAPYKYAWNTTPIQTTGTITNLIAGSYTVTITDTNGCTTTASTIITQPTSLSSSITKADAKCFDSSDGSATVMTMGGTPPYTYTWNTSPVQTSNSISSLSAGIYKVIVTDQNGCKDSAAVTILQPTPVSTIIASVPVSCNGGNNAAATVAVSGGTAPYTFIWSTTPVQNAATANGLSAGTYTVVVTDSNGCVVPTSVHITQPPPFIATITAWGNILCAGANNGFATVQASGGKTPYYYLWNTAQTTAAITNLAPGFYKATIIDSNGCVAKDSITLTSPLPIITTLTNVSPTKCNGDSTGTAQLNVSGGVLPYSYTWSTLPGWQAALATQLPAGTQTVTVTDSNGCMKTDTFAILQPAPMVLQTGTSNTCSNLQNALAYVTINGGNTPYTINWNTNPVQHTDTIKKLSMGTYGVTVIDANGCAKTASAFVDSFLSPVITAGPNAAICDGASLQLFVTGAKYYTWYPNTWLSCNSCDSPMVRPDSAIMYTVVGVDTNNCSDSAQVHLSVVYPVPTSVGTGKSICMGDSTQLSATGGIHYLWTPTYGLNNPQIPNPIAAPATTTNYQVIITENDCFADTLTQEVQVHALPGITMGQGQTVLAGTALAIPIQTNDATAIRWTPSTGLSCADCFNPIATLYKTITYTAIAYNDIGCQSSSQITYRVVCNNSVLFLPNAFTPNGDGVNDFFYPMGKGIEKVKRLAIFNRWGQKVFEAFDIPTGDEKVGWDGSFKGARQMPDMYVYFIEATCTTGEPVFLKGDVSLIH